MVKLVERTDSLERLLERVVTMLGKANERADDFNRRLTNLERFILQSAAEQTDTFTLKKTH